MTKVMAWEHLHDPHYCSGLDTIELYNLMLRAGYDREVAQEAANKRGWERLDKGVSM